MTLYAIIHNAKHSNCLESIHDSFDKAQAAINEMKSDPRMEKDYFYIVSRSLNYRKAPEKE